MDKILSAGLFLMISLSYCVGGTTADSPSPTEQPTTAESKVEQSVPKPEKVNAVAVEGTLWAIDEENMLYLADAIARDDNEYLRQLAFEKKFLMSTGIQKSRALARQQTKGMSE